MGEPSIYDKFASIFRGYDKNYVKHTPPFKRGADGKIKAKFTGIAKFETGSSLHEKPYGNFEDGDDVPVTTGAYAAHIDGKQGLAVSPLMDTNINGTIRKDVCYFAVIDIDIYGYDFVPLIERLYSFKYKFAAFTSKSGGLHLYFIFQKAESAAAARAALLKIVEVFGLNKIFVSSSGTSRVEVFPEHDVRQPGVHDKAVLLPYYNHGNGNGVLDDDGSQAAKQKMINAQGQYVKLERAIEAMEQMFTSVSQIEAATEALPYNEAPFCIQMLLLSGILGENSGRNEFLVTGAIYLKTKDGPAFDKADLEQMNYYLGAPVEQKEIDGIFSSVSKKDYQLFGRCDKEPCSTFCDKKLCKLRQYGVGRTKGNVVSNVEFGKIIRMKAETPYYLWEARLAGNEEYKLLRIDGSENLLNQKTIQKACIDTLGQLSITVAQSKWEETVNTCLLTLEEREVEKATDTTEMAELRELFVRFLTNKQVRNAKPYTVQLRQVYATAGKFYFKTEGFKEYLRASKYNIGRTNLREQLLLYGCKEGKLPYATATGEQKLIDCWVKEEDDQLADMTTFFDDILEADAQVIGENLLHKEDDRGSPDADDQRF